MFFNPKNRRVVFISRRLTARQQSVAQNCTSSLWHEDVENKRSKTNQIFCQKNIRVTAGFVLLQRSAWRSNQFRVSHAVINKTRSNESRLFKLRFSFGFIWSINPQSFSLICISTSASQSFMWLQSSKSDHHSLLTWTSYPDTHPVGVI